MARNVPSPFKVEVSESPLDTLRMPKSVLPWSVWLLDAPGDALLVLDLIGDTVTSSRFSNSD
jgi:hypothetical protein